jgi:hypothetical protein
MRAKILRVTGDEIYDYFCLSQNNHAGRNANVLRDLV